LGDRKGIRPVKHSVVDGDDLNGALHVLQLQLMPPLASLASIKPANPHSPGKKWPLKHTERNLADIELLYMQVQRIDSCGVLASEG